MAKANNPPFCEETHAELLSSSSALNSVRVRQPPSAEDLPAPLRVAAWNLERCKHVEETAKRISDSGADIALLTEADIGMFRSGNKDTIAELADRLGMGQAAGVEFVELGAGDDRETAECRGGENSAGLHCNAVLSGTRIDGAAILPLDPGGAWFAGKPGKGQRRVGGRNAVGIRISAPMHLWAIAVHFESEGTSRDRAKEAERLVAAIDCFCGEDAAAVVGGDFNFNALPASAHSIGAGAENPETYEGTFTVMKEAGFCWETCNASGPTTRRHPWDKGYFPKKLDWLFVRGVAARNPAIIPATGSDGGNLTDHEMVCVDIAPL